jgi:hypothetical protein
MAGMTADFRYCPSCGTRNAATEEGCVKCGVVFSQFRRMDVVIQAGSEKGINTRTLVIGMGVVLGLLFGAYVMYVQKFMPKGPGKDPGGLPLVSARAEVLYKGLLQAGTEEEIEKINAEIKGLQSYLNLIPEGQDMEANLILQKNLAEMERLSHFPSVVNAATMEDIRKRFKIIRKRLGFPMDGR